MSDEELHPLAALRTKRPSDKAIAAAVWGRSHCQFHTATQCNFIEDILHDAERIDRGEPSWFDIESARYDAMGKS